MSFLSDANAGLTDALEVMGVDFVYESATKRGVQTDNTAELMLMPGGFLADYRFSLVCRTTDFSAVPTSGKTLTLAGVPYRVLRATYSDGDPGFTLDCGSVDK